MSAFYVYLHKKSSDGVVYYVGKGHGRRAFDLRARNRNVVWARINAKHGTDVEIIRSGLTEQEAFALEVETIKMFRDMGFFLANLTDGGEGVVDHTGEIGKKISAKLKGKPKSAEHRAAFAAARRGSKDSEETRAKKSAAAKGKVFSEKHRENLSKGSKGERTEKQLQNCKKGGLANAGKTSEAKKIAAKKSWDQNTERKTNLSEKIRADWEKNRETRYNISCAAAKDPATRAKNAEGQKRRKRIADELGIPYHSVTKEVLKAYKETTSGTH